MTILSLILSGPCIPLCRKKILDALVRARISKRIRPLRRALYNNCRRTLRTTTMGAVKRKEAPGGDAPSKKAKATKDSRPSKREQPSKVKDEAPKTKTTSSSSAAAPPQPTVVSLLKEDEPMFPRGGGSVLTPLEQKQIQIEAKADALKENDEFDTYEKAKSKKERKKSKMAAHDGSGKGASDAEGIKIESLNYKVHQFANSL